MNSKHIHHLVFILHRYIGLVVGLIIIIIGFTGSLLVFQEEIDHRLIQQQFGKVIPLEERIPIDSVVDTFKAAYREQPNIKLQRIFLPAHLDDPYKVSITSANNEYVEVFIHPYTGKVLGSRQWDNTIVGVTFRLHYALLAGDTGIVFVGIVGLLLLIVCLTGIFLWPGWRRLIAGFKIKWNSHPKRFNFDLHKVAGILSGGFLALTALTGFCWNCYDFTYPLIYAATLTSPPVDPVSQVIAAQPPIKLSEVLQRADAALPGTTPVSIILPSKPEGVFRVRKRFPQEVEPYGRSDVYLDQYSGKVLAVKDKHKLPLGDAVLDAFVPLHFGTFGGLPTRILYMFVGLTPLMLFSSGFIMWWYRWKPKKSTHQSSNLVGDTR
jgi:uncharacterized iron-regulated membrane protein